MHYKKKDHGETFGLLSSYLHTQYITSIFLTFVLTATFLKSYKSIDDKIANWRIPKDKHAYINQFSSSKWSKTSLARKKLHTLRNCQICTTFHGPVASLFPESKNFKSKTKSPLTNIVNSTTKAIPINAKPTNAEIREIGNMIYSELDKTCKENIGTSFKDMLIKTPEVNLQEKKESSGEEKRYAQSTKVIQNSNGRNVAKE